MRWDSEDILSSDQEVGRGSAISENEHGGSVEEPEYEASDAPVVALGSSPGDPIELHQASQVQPLWHRIHPLGVVVCALLVASVIATVVGTDYLIGNLAWWHWLGLLALLALSLRLTALHAFRLRLEGITTITGGVAKYLGWLVFLVSLFNVVTRYTGRYIETDIIIGEMMSFAWMTFAFMFLIGMNWGVREQINPRIDFWWAEFSDRRKAWLDFVMHVFFFLPFVLVAIRILWDYGRKGLGMKFTGEWPDGWHVWNSWETAWDAGSLPIGPIKFLTFIGFVLLGFQVLAEIIKTGFVIIGREDLADLQKHDEFQRIE